MVYIYDIDRSWYIDIDMGMGMGLYIDRGRYIDIYRGLYIDRGWYMGMGMGMGMDIYR